MGPQGEIGPQGDTGPQGPQGSQGIPTIGDTGPQGATGILGPQGDTGDTGPYGVIGPQGPQGPAGPQGSDGQGPQGPQGPVGTVKGPPGDQGDEGPQGPQGPTGDPGPPGATGDTGPPGDQGPPGDTGDTGPEGIGPQGPQGPPGPDGYQGPQGPSGDAGPQGDTGNTGPDGFYGPGLPLYWIYYSAFNYTPPGYLSTYNNTSYTNVIAYTTVTTNSFQPTYIADNWTLMEEIDERTTYGKSYSSIYIDFITSNTLVVYTPDIINSTNGGAIGEYIQVRPNSAIMQSVSVNDFIDFTGYDINIDGGLILRIWQIGQSDGFIDIDIYKLTFYSDWSAITTTSDVSPFAIGPTPINASQGSHP